MEIIKMKIKVGIYSLAIVLLLLTACSSGANSQENGIPDPLPCGEEVEWELWVKILNQGDVVQVTQLHSLEVTLHLSDGCEITTVEPLIDDIFKEVEQCGEPCEGMTLATE
jgi:hypothetical protein